jgi:hypothetical protein
MHRRCVIEREQDDDSTATDTVPALTAHHEETSTSASHEKSRFSLKNDAFWDLTLCGSCENRRFGENCHLHYQDETGQRASNSISID